MNRGILSLWHILWIAPLCLLLATCISGCATGDDLRAHEERHCEGWMHQEATDGQAVIFYDWIKTRPASVKPWAYVYVDDTHAACAKVVAHAVQGRRIDACATWKPQGCEIILPKD